MKDQIISTPECQVIADLAREAALKRLEVRTASYTDASPFVILRDENGKEFLEFLTLHDPRLHPTRKTGTTALKDAQSFIAYYKMHAKRSPVYASLDPAQFIAVLNDHSENGPGQRDFRAIYKVGHSREWVEWQARNGHAKAFTSTEEFALFLEDNSPDIIDPAPSVMIELALNFRVRQDVAFADARRLQDGHTNIAYHNLVTADAAGKAGTINIPETFLIEVPIFEGLNAPKWRISARFRFRLRDGKLTIWYELIRPHKVVEEAFKALWVEIQTETGAPILHGLPA